MVERLLMLRFLRLRRHSPLLIWKEFLDANNNPRPLLGVLPAKGADDDPLYQYLRLEAGMRTELETTRLLYIGVTRAIHQAWLFGNIKTGKEGLSAPARSLLQTIFPQLLQDPGELNVTLSPAPGILLPEPLDADEMQYRQPLLRLPANWSSPLPGVLLPLVPAADTSELSDDQALAATIGELVHLGLKQIAEQGLGWLQTAASLPIWERELRQLCTDRQQLQKATTVVMEHLQRCVTAADAEWLFKTIHTDDKCELALADFSTGYRRDFIVDRTFVNQQGERWIIDYKSASPRIGQALANFYEEQTTLYRPQLENYRRLLVNLFMTPGQSVRLALFFTAIPHLHLLD